MNYLKSKLQVAEIYTHKTANHGFVLTHFTKRASFWFQLAELAYLKTTKLDGCISY